MVKIKVFKAHMNHVIENGAVNYRKCLPGEIINIQEAFQEHLDGEIYGLFGNTRAISPSKIQESRQRVDTSTNNNELRSVVSNLENAINGAMSFLNKLKQVDSDQIPINEKEISKSEIIITPSDEKQTIIKTITPVYSSTAYRNRQMKIRDIIKNNVYETDEKGKVQHSINEMQGVLPHMPKFAAENAGITHFEGEITIENNNSIVGKDILDMTPTDLQNMKVIKDEKGRIDVFQTLGATVVRP